MPLQFKPVLAGILNARAWLVAIGMVVAAGPFASVALAQRPPAVPAPSTPAAPEKPRIAILEFNGVDASRAELASATDQLRDDFVKTGRYTVLDRSQVSAVLGEQAFQREGVTEASQAVELGKLLNVEFIVTGRLTRLTGAYQLSTQLVEVRTARVAHTETIRQRGEFLAFLDSLTPLTARMAGIAAAPTAPTMRLAEPAAPPEPPAPPVPRTVSTGGAAPFSVYGNAIPLDDNHRVFVEISVARTQRDFEATDTYVFTTGTVVDDPFDITMQIARTTFYAGFGVGEAGLMRLGLGGLSLHDTEAKSSEDDLTGGELAVDFRSALGPSGPIRGVVFVSFRGGAVKNDFVTGSFGQFDFGAGVTARASESLSVYGGALLSTVVATLEATPQLISDANDTLRREGFRTRLVSATEEITGKNLFGVVAGITLHLGPSANVGAEIHSGHESGSSISLALRF